MVRREGRKSTQLSTRVGMVSIWDPKEHGRRICRSICHPMLFQATAERSSLRMGHLSRRHPSTILPLVYIWASKKLHIGPKLEDWFLGPNFLSDGYGDLVGKVKSY